MRYLEHLIKEWHLLSLRELPSNCGEMIVEAAFYSILLGLQLRILELVIQPRLLGWRGKGTQVHHHHGVRACHPVDEMQLTSC